MPNTYRNLIVATTAFAFAACNTVADAAATATQAPIMPDAVATAKAANANCSDFLGGVICPEVGNLTLRTGSNLTEYYAYVAATTSSKFSVKAGNNWFVSKMKDLLGLNKSYSARIDLELRLKTNGGEQPLGTFALLAFKVVDGQVTEEKAGTVQALLSTPITNSFSLRAGDQVAAIIRVTSTEDTSLNLSTLLTNIKPLSDAIGGGLATAVTGNIATAGAGFADNAMTNKQVRSAEFRSVLGAPDGQIKTISFVAPASPGASTSDFKLTLTLVPRASLILPTAANADLKWSSTILNPEGQVTLANGETLSVFLRRSGIPARAFSIVPPTGDTPLDAKLRVNQACSDLEEALTRVDYVPLNQFDSEVIIRERLNNAADSLDSNTITAQCIVDRQRPGGIWAKYEIPSIPVSDMVIVDQAAATFFFPKLNVALAGTDQATRRDRLGPLTDQSGFTLEAPLTVLPGHEGEWGTNPADGVGRDLGTRMLSNLRSCALGTYGRPAGPDRPNAWTFLILPENSKEILEGLAIFGRAPDNALILRSLTFQPRPSDHKIEGQFAKDPDVIAVMGGGGGGPCT